MKGGLGVGVGGLFWGRSGWQFEGIRGGVAPWGPFQWTPCIWDTGINKGCVFRQGLPYLTRYRILIRTHLPRCVADDSYHHFDRPTVLPTLRDCCMSHYAAPFSFSSSRLIHSMINYAAECCRTGDCLRVLCNFRSASR